jgi:hypothetical protein
MANSMPKLFAMPHSADPRVNVKSASAKILRAPNLSANQPLTGMNTANVRMYVVIARFSLTGVVSRLRAMAGIAVVMMVESSCSIRKAMATIIGMISLSLGSRSVAN